VVIQFDSQQMAQKSMIGKEDVMDKQDTYLVEADHPVFRRIYDRFKSEEEARALVEDIKDFNYENITINGKDA
jgi:hypothetical protein